MISQVFNEKFLNHLELLTLYFLGNVSYQDWEVKISQVGFCPGDSCD